VWAALSETGFFPSLVRRTDVGDGDPTWERYDGWDEVGTVRRNDVFDALYLATRFPRKGPLPDATFEWPTSIYDRRVVLPDDPRFKKARNVHGDKIAGLLARRNTCPDDEVAAIDATILNLSPRDWDFTPPSRHRSR
jgi:hypothetical protein